MIHLNENLHGSTSPAAGQSVSLSDIEQQVKAFADLRTQLATIVQELNDQVEQLKRQKMPMIRKLVARAAEKHAALEASVNQSAALFIKPRTLTVHGIKVGFRKGTGGIDWDDDATVVKLIKKHLEDQAQVLIKTTEKPIANALANLEVADLKRIGCRVESTSDVVVIKPVDSDVDKVVNALLKTATEEAAE